MRIWKEVLRPGTFWYADQVTGQPRKLVVTSNGVRYLHQQGNAMRAAGLSIPIPAEHQVSAFPLTAEQRARASADQLLTNAGWVERYDIRHGDRLYGLCDVPSPETFAKLPRTIKYTSPWINSFTDGNGKKWDGVISHLALTSRPRITAQEPFTDANVALSMATLSDTLLTHPYTSEGIVLSLAGLLEPGPGGELVPHRPMAFSMWTGATLAMDEEEVETLAPEKKKGADKGSPFGKSAEKKGPGPQKKEGSEKKAGKAPPFGKKEGEDKPSEGKKPDGDAGSDEPEDATAGMHDDTEMTLTDVLCEVVSALWGIELPEDTDEDNLAQNLLTAMMAQMKGEGAGGEPPPETPSPGGAGAAEPPPIVQESPPMFMSLEKVQAITDPETREIAQALLSLQQEHATSTQKTAALEKRTLDGARAARDRRVEAICGRVRTAGFRERLLAQARSVQLSLDANGNVSDPMNIMLDLLESGITDIPSLLLNGGSPSVVEQPHPTDHSGEMSRARLEEVTAELAKVAGLEEMRVAG